MEINIYWIVSQKLTITVMCIMYVHYQHTFTQNILFIIKSLIEKIYWKNYVLLDCT